MPIRQHHEIHGRRFGRNLGVGLTLVAFIVLIFGLTVAKVQTLGPTEGFDHVVRPGLIEGEAR